MDPQVLNAINGAVVLVFVILVILAIVRIGARYIGYKRAGLEVPALLPRDFFLFVGLGVPFLGTLLFRFLEIRPIDYAWYPLWVITSGIIGLAGTAYWVYVEYFKIEK